MQMFLLLLSIKIEICALLRYYACQMVNLYRKASQGLPFDAALYPGRAQISSTLWRKPEITESVEVIGEILYIPHTL
jgi:hypothetical protein